MTASQNIPRSAPESASTPKTQLVAAETACAASGAWTSTGIISLDSGIWRRLCLMLDVECIAIGNVVALMPLISRSDTSPATAVVDDWFQPCTTDGTTTTTAMTGALPASTVFTLPPSQVVRTQRPIVLASAPTLNTTDEQRYAFEPIDITGARWFQILYAESVTGTPATPSKIGLWYSLAT